jgi:hypothetical protein
MKGQSHKASLVEQTVNQAIGYGIAYWANIWLIPLLFKVQINHAQANGIVILMTLISMVRGYACRRLFNAIEVHKAKRSQ